MDSLICFALEGIPLGRHWVNRRWDRKWGPKKELEAKLLNLIFAKLGLDSEGS